MGKRTKEFYKMMDLMRQQIAQASQPNQYETMLAAELAKRQSRSTADIMSDNLGNLSDWQRLYQAGTTPEGSVKNKGYKLQLGMARDLGAREIARDYGKMGEQSVRDYRNQTLGLTGSLQDTAAQRQWNTVGAWGNAAQMWNNFKPKKSWWDTIVGGAMDVANLAASAFSAYGGRPR